MQMMQFQEERMYAAASALKGMERIISDTIEWAKDRHTFGQPVINNQTVHFKLAELQSEIEALRALTWQACQDHIEGKDATYLASIAKLKSGRLWRQVTDGCLQYWAVWVLCGTTLLRVHIAIPEYYPSLAVATK